MTASHSLWNPPRATDAERDQLRAGFVGLVGVDCSRVSDLVIDQLIYAMRTKVIDVFAVTDILQGLEGRPGSHGTKRAEQFSRPKGPLRGLWKAHFFDARSSMAENLVNEMNSRPGKAALKQHFRENSGEVFNPAAIVDIMVTQAYERRADDDRITGEWIVFAVDPTSGQNFYLTLAAHKEGGDQVIFDRMRSRLSPRFAALLPVRPLNPT